MTEAEWIAFFSRPEIPAFNRTMAEHADAPLPRLVFADWVEENCGDAGFVESLRESIDGPWRRFPCRGFPKRLVTTFDLHFGRLGVLVDDKSTPVSRPSKRVLHEAVWNSGWIGHVSVAVNAPEELNRWLAHPALQLVEGLDCGVDYGFGYVPQPVLRHLFATLRAPLLRRLDLAHCSLGDTGALALSRCEPLDELRELNLTANGLSAGGAGAIIGSTSFPSLARLTLDHNPIGNEGLQHLLYARPRQRLTFLSIQNTGIGSVGVRYLANSPCLSELHELRATPDEVGPEGAAALANSRYLPEPIRAQWLAILQEWAL